MSRLFVLFSFLILSLPVFAQKPVTRKIENLGNNIYRFQNNTHYSIFIVGKSSLLMTDPIDAEAATWLKNEVKKRFGELPIKYVIYSHNHLDHVAGGEVFKEPRTTIIAHELAAEDLNRNKAPTAMPDQTFSDRMDVMFEDRLIQLAYYGPNNGAGSISLYVPDAKFLFVVDWIVLKRLPWREMYYYNVDGTIASLKKVLNLDFVKVAPGHSIVGNKEDVRAFLGYLEELRSEVLKAMVEGKDLKWMQENIKMKKYSKYASFDHLPDNIKGVYDQMERTSGRYGQEK